MAGLILHTTNNKSELREVSCLRKVGLFHYWNWKINHLVQLRPIHTKKNIW